MSRHQQPGCALEPGHSWTECLCAEIDPSDRPCMSCEALAQSAALCTGCRTELSRREIRTALATGTYMGKVIDIRKGKRS